MLTLVLLITTFAFTTTIFLVIYWKTIFSLENRRSWPILPPPEKEKIEVFRRALCNRVGLRDLEKLASELKRLRLKVEEEMNEG